MKRLRFHSVFSRLFTSVMLALIAFAVAMVFLTQVVQDNDASMRSKVLGSQVIQLVTPFLNDLDSSPSRLQSRFILAGIKNKFDEYDQSLNAKMALYNSNNQLLIQTENSDLPSELPTSPSWLSQSFPIISGEVQTGQVQINSQTGYTLLFEKRKSATKKAQAAKINLFTGTLLLLLIMSLVLFILSKSMTWRLGQLSKQIEKLGSGNLGARVSVRGKDEIATLAKGFNQSAEQIEKLVAANNLLLAHASHEIRTPITRMRLQIEMMAMLANQLPEAAKTKFDKRANAINRDLSGLNDLIESILLVSRLDAGHALQQLKRFNLYELIQQESQHYEHATLYGEHLTIQGQPKLLIHLIRNLFNNAMIHGIPPLQVYLYGIESTEDAADIPDRLLEEASLIESTLTTLDVKKETAPQLFQRKNKSTKTTINNYAVIAVVDQGIGIPTDKRDEIFSPFVRLQQGKKGSGLGLSLVAHIVEAHQGKIITDTWQGHTRFLVCLPINQPKKPSLIHSMTK